MKILIEFLAVALVVVVGLAFAARMLKNHQQKLNSQMDALTVCINDLTDRMDRYEIVGRRQLREREEVVSTSLNQLQTDLKLMQMQNHEPAAGREAPEALEQAIQLARDGKPSDYIMKKTGLSIDVVDAITMLHSARPRH